MEQKALEKLPAAAGPRPRPLLNDVVFHLLVLLPLQRGPRTSVFGMKDMSIDSG